MPDTIAVSELLELLTFEEIDTDIYRAARLRDEGTMRLFGGQVVAQALAAASASVEAGQRPHSLHAYFLRPGNPRRPVVLHVERDFDGTSFANRRVIARQGGEAILNLTASFQHREAGLAHAVTMPDVPAPEGSPAYVPEVRTTSLVRCLAAFDIRLAIAPTKPQEGRPASRAVWFRLPSSPGGDPFPPAMPYVLLAYISDFALLPTAVLTHPVDYTSPALQMASLDHAIWFHADPRPGEWHCYLLESPWAGAARAFVRGTVFARDGTMVASVAQEGLLRVRRPPPPSPPR